MKSTFEDALLLHQNGKFAEAETIYREILRAEPRHADAQHYLGMIAYAHGRNDEALRLVDAALALNPTSTAALANRASILANMKRNHEALAGYDAALALDPQNIDVLSNKGAVLCELDRLHELIALVESVITSDPRHAKARISHGNVLLKLDRRDEAVAAYDIALSLVPGDSVAHFGRGKALLEMQRPAEALKSFQYACAIRPDYAEAHWCQAICFLMLGDFSRGWEKYEWRWGVSPQKETARKFPQPLWLGHELITGRRLLVHAEQGFGDTLQFCRYIRKLADRGADVILEIQPELKLLLSSLAGPAAVIARGEPLPPFDMQCPLLSLPRALGTTLQTVPASLGYLSVPPARIEHWRQRLPANGKPRIGLAWFGRSTHVNDRHRSLDPNALTPLLRADATFVSLHVGHRPRDQAWLAAHPGVLHYDAHLGDFSETAELAAAMDLIISVDTSIAHLAGALGLAVWILLPFVAVDYRWLLGRNDSPWYPTASLFRQPTVGDWKSVIADVSRHLDHYLSNPSAS